MLKVMPKQLGRHSKLSKRGIEENSFQCVPLHTGQSSNGTIDQRAFFSSQARNLEKLAITRESHNGYNEAINDLKVLYPQILATGPICTANRSSFLSCYSFFALLDQHNPGQPHSICEVSDYQRT